MRGAGRSIDSRLSVCVALLFSVLCHIHSFNKIKYDINWRNKERIEVKLRKRTGEPVYMRSRVMVEGVVIKQGMRNEEMRNKK